MPVTQIWIDRLDVRVYPNRDEMGRSAAREAAQAIRGLLAEQEEINLIFAAAPSQSEFLRALCAEGNIDWGRVNAFHMDEYVGLAVGQEGSFTDFLNKRVFERLPFKAVFRLNGAAEDADRECGRYAQLLRDHPVDLVFMGVGENGHIAFNDPSVADFNDSVAVKVVELERVCRMQQVHDKCFPTLEDVPERAYTLTIPARLSANRIFCMVPGQTKAAAVERMLSGQIGENCPASILRRHASAILYLDQDSAQDFLPQGKF